MPIFDRNILILKELPKPTHSVKKQINILICLLKKNVIAVSDCKNPKLELKTSAELSKNKCIMNPDCFSRKYDLTINKNKQFYWHFLSNFNF